MAAMAHSTPPTRVRYGILALAVTGHVITQLVQPVFGMVMPQIRTELILSMEAIGPILAAFQLAATVSRFPGAWIGDRFGPRRVVAGAVALWSICCIATGGMWSVTSLVICRFFWGLGTVGEYALRTRSLARWILPSERGGAMGIAHGAARLGTAFAVAPAAWGLSHFGWRPPLICLGVIGAMWVAVWCRYYRDSPLDHPGVNQAELSRISESIELRESPGYPVPWKRILKSRQVWTLAAAYGCYLYALAAYKGWFPEYLTTQPGGRPKMEVLAWALMVTGALGAIVGGWASDRLVLRLGLASGRRVIAASGFLLAGISAMAGSLTHHSPGMFWYPCLATFGLEMTVAVSWAVTLDIGGDACGTVCAVMNGIGNLIAGAALVASRTLIQNSGWDAAFGAMAGICILGAALFTQISAERKIA